MKQTLGVGEDERKKKQEECERMFQRLCAKLDALSNFHFTPKPPKEEMAVQTKVAAIKMEEVRAGCFRIAPTTDIPTTSAL